MVTEDGRVFVARFDRSGVGEHLVSFDPSTDQVDGIATGALGGLAWGDGSLWALEKSDRLLRIDPATGELMAEVRVDVDPNTHMEVASGGGAAWVTSDALALRRISPDGAAVAATIDTGGGIPFDVDGGLVWGARPDEIWAVDPGTNDVARRVALDDTIEVLDLDIEGDEAWLAVRRPGAIGKVLHVSLATGAVVGEFDVSLPSGIAIAPDRVWVTSYLTNELLGFRRG